ncbi:envelope stress response protein PspG [Citrobacter freundii]|uniref:envelope stress response protein PspG n=1 Tax=Citrobacter freundii TaxID=546 RepID=UPI000D744802|nr:envelope stress response protein PspG [Citrobacter freundii]PXG98887.1 envelope stress response protein PspG [Citrobacter freundii]
MLELLFVIGFFIMLMVTGVSLLGVLAALVVATAVMFLGGLFALMIKLLPWLLLAVAVVWVIKAIKAPKVPKVPQYQRNNRRFY